MCRDAPSGSAVKNPPAVQEMQEPWIQLLGGEDPLEAGTATTAVFLPGEYHGQRSLAGYGPCAHPESDMTEHSTAHLCVWRTR